jgi:CNT family concentrative nucleoside transporter
MTTLIAIAGIVLLLAVSYLMSNDKRNVNIRAIGIMGALQLGIAFLMLHTTVGGKVLSAVTSAFNKVLSFGNTGVSFVFGSLSGKYIFFIDVLMSIIFVSSLLGILTYTRILPLAVKYIGGFVSKVTGLPKVESFVAVNSMVFGDTSAILSVKSFIPSLSGNRLFVVTTSSLVAVSCTILGAYMSMIPAQFVLVALPINVFSGLILSTIVCPVNKIENEEEIDIKEMIPEKSFFEAVGNWTLLGGKTALIVGAMLVTYVSLLALVDWIFLSLFHISFTQLLGYVFAPIAYMMGVPVSEMIKAGSVMGTKVASNEFVAMLSFMKMIPHLSHKTVGIVSAFLISFANFSSIGIILGTIQAISQQKASEFAKIGLKVLLVATMGSILTGTIVGLFL